MRYRQRFINDALKIFFPNILRIKHVTNKNKMTKGQRVNRDKGLTGTKG